MDAIVAPRRLHTQVVDALLALIVSGKAEPGSALPTEPHMSERFGVSRSVVREALRVLGEKGLVEVRHGAGAFVTPPERWDNLDPAVLAAMHGRKASVQVLRDLLEARKIVECEVAALAAARADAADVAALEGALVTMRASLAHPPTFVIGDSSFHRALVRAARNQVLERMAAPMHALLSYAQALTDAMPGVLTRALDDHEAIAAAVTRGDPPGARSAMHHHLAQTERDVIALTEAP